MITADNLLPNHYKSLYKEMMGVVENRIFDIDFKGFIKTVYEDTILEEFDHEIIGVPEFVRGGERKNQRNGFYARSLETAYGWVQEIRIPRPRRGGFTPRCLQKHGRREQNLNRLMQACYFRGISTRDVEKIVYALSGSRVSSSAVSRLTDHWETEIKRWHQRELNDTYVYLMFDGVWIKNRSMGGKRRLILVAYGIQGNGIREVIDYAFAQSESTESWHKFLNNLCHRGLKGESLKLITTDHCRGLMNAIDMVYPTVPHQLCWAHKMRNVVGKAKAADKEEIRKGLVALFDGEWNRKTALQLINKWKEKWKRQCSEAVYCLDKDLDAMLLYLDCPQEHHRAIRTSNHIERQFKEYRRRMRSMEVTPTKLSADKILFAQTMFRNEKLRKYPMSFTQKTLH